MARPSTNQNPNVVESSTRDKSIIAEYADITTVHGIKDLYVAWREHFYAKWVWIFLLIASASLMFYQMLQAMLNYLQHPTATRILQLYRDSYDYPLMLLCPDQWINATRVKRLALPKSTLAYALSFLHLLTITQDPPIIDFKGTSDLLNEIMTRNHFRNVFDLFLNVSDDSERMMTCSSCEEWPLKKVVTQDGVCYQVRLKPAEVSFIIEEPPQVTYTPSPASKQDVDDWTPTYTRGDSTDQFYVGYYPNDFFSSDPIKLSYNSTYVIKITPMLQRRFIGYQVKRACYERPEMENINHSQRMCYSDCKEWTYGVACRDCQYIGFSFDRSDRPRAPWYSSMTYAKPSPSYLDECVRRNRIDYERCAAKCLPPCEEWIYDTTVVVVSNKRMWINKEEAAVTIVISYQVKAGTLAIEEISTYTYHTFLSNIGGQLVLWLGASMISVFQAIFFLIRLSYHWWTEKERQKQ